MLKIKSNTNEFTIIFSEKIVKKKKECSIDLVQPLFSSAPLLLFSFFSSCFSVFSFFFSPSVFSAPLLFLFFLPFFSFQFTCALFFSPKQFSLQPKNIFFSSEHFCFSPKPFSVQPTPPFQPFFLFVGSVFYAPFLFVQRLLFFFLFQRLILFFLPTSKAKNILFRCFTFLLFE